MDKNDGAASLVRSDALFAQVIPLAPLLQLLSEQCGDANEYNICITHDGAWRAIRNEDLERMSANAGAVPRRGNEGVTTCK